MPDTQAMPADGKKGASDGTNTPVKGAESSGGAYPNGAGGRPDPDYHGPKNDGDEGGETVDRD